MEFHSGLSEICFNVFINYFEMRANNEITVCAGDTHKINTLWDKSLLGRIAAVPETSEAPKHTIQTVSPLEGSEREYAKRDICWSKIM